MTKHKYNHCADRECPHSVPHESAPLHVAAIGASAGGLDPLITIISAIQSDSDVSWSISRLYPRPAARPADRLQRIKGLTGEQFSETMKSRPDMGETITQNAPLTRTKVRHQPEKSNLSTQTDDWQNKTKHNPMQLKKIAQIAMPSKAPNSDARRDAGYPPSRVRQSRIGQFE